MQITGTPPPAQGAQTTEAQPLTAQLRVGQTLQAVAKGVTPEGLLKLQIGRDMLLAQSQSTPKPGQTLVLQVERAGQAPELRLIAPPDAAPIRAEALRSILPRMLAIAPALDQLMKIAAPGGQHATLPSEVRQAVRQMAEKLPDLRQLSNAEGLRSTLAQSGLFTEARLANRQIPEADLKSALLRIAHQLRASAEAPAPSAKTPQAATSNSSTAQLTPQARPGQNPPPNAGANIDTGGSSRQTRAPNTGQSQNNAPGPRAPSVPSAPSAPTTPQHPSPVSPSPTHTLRTPQTATEPLPTQLKTNNPTLAASESAAVLSKTEQKAAGNIPARLLLSPTVRLFGATPASGAATPPPIAGLNPSTATVASLGAGLVFAAKPAKERANASSTSASAQVGGGALSQRIGAELSRQVEGALARLQYHQLASLPQEESNRQVWQLELPVRNEQQLDAIKLRIEEQGNGQQASAESSSWRVDLSFELESLGPVQVRIGLQGERISSTFWAERTATTALISARLEELRQGLESVGLEVGELASRLGTAPPPETKITEQVLDERA